VHGILGGCLRLALRLLASYEGGRLRRSHDCRWRKIERRVGVAAKKVSARAKERAVLQKKGLIGLV
jgi:hypothetical protein